MKLFTFIFIILNTIIACSSTKQVVESSKEVTKTEKNDSIKKLINVNKETNTISISPPEPCFTNINTTNICIVPSVNPKEFAKIPVDNSETYLRTNFDKSNKTKEKVNHTFIYGNLLNRFVSEKGNVNYKGFIVEQEGFEAYLETLANNLPKEDWTHEDKLAYWMNVYNAFTIKLIIDNYPTKSIKDIKDAWDARFFKLGKKWYNLNDVEHKILRKMGDPRIHFGINCASYSCPPLLNKAFTAANVDEELEKLAIGFINDPTRNKISSDRVQLSKIFQWFGKDFKTQGSLIDYLNKYSKTPINSNAKKSYLKYDWNLNE